MRLLRLLIIVPVASLLAIAAARTMSFIAPASHPLHSARAWFPGHPKALTNRSMAQIGASAAANGGVPGEAREGIAALARSSPLAPEPFLVEGTIAQLDGKPAQAERLFLAAKARDPRSDAARFFLAERYLKTGRIVPGLIESAVLARLSGNAAEPLIPALATFARTPGATAELKRFFRKSPYARDRTLLMLAADPRNAELVLSLAPPPERGPKAPEWQVVLIRGLVEAGDFAGADRIWSRLSGVADRGLLYNPQFRNTGTAPPFNWEFNSGSAGVAEPAGGGGLQIIYYGREPAVLARQMLRLPAGRYRLAMRIDGLATGGGVAWTVQCVAAPQPIARVPIDPSGAKAVSGEFVVPADCPAQLLDLRGDQGDTAATTQLTISGLSLTRAGAGS